MKNFILIVTTIVLVVNLCACSKEQYEDPFRFSENQKAEMLNLAQKYGVEVKINDYGKGEKPSLKDFEDFLKLVVDFKNAKYEMVLSGKNSSKLLSRNISTRSAYLEGIESTSGSWQGVGFGDEYGFMSVDVSWTTPIAGCKGEASGTSEYSFTCYGNYRYYQTGFNYEFAGSSSLDFTFSGEIWRDDWLEAKVYKSGTIYTETGTGMLD